jgi:hypothetical protein
MLIELAYVLGKPKKISKFTTAQEFIDKDKDDDTDSSSGVWFYLWLAVIIIYAVSLLGIWIRFVFVGFSCSVVEGFCSLFFTSLYGFWKLTSLIQASCTKSSSLF